MKSIKHTIKIIAPTLIVGLLLGWLFFHSSNNEAIHNHEQETAAVESIYTCSMHPQIKQNKPGLCPICAMDLVPMATMESEGEHVDPNEIQMTESALALASIQTTKVKMGIPTKELQLLGKVKADERNISELTARFGGRIETLSINYTGQQVKKGQKLGTIYSPELISAQKELLEALKYKTSNPSFYKASRSKLKLWDLTDEQIDAIESRGETKTVFDIQSPISGTVTKRYISVGDYVKEGAPLFKIIDLSKVWVMFDAYESDLPWIKKGDDVEFTLQAFPGKQFNGKVSFIEPFIDPQTRVAQVRIELRNSDGQLKPEMFAKGILKSNTAKNTNELLIPKSAILWTGKKAVVYVKVSDRETSSFIYRQITLGPEAGDFYIVNDGLSEGEEIAMNGVFKIDAAAQLAGKSSMMNPGGGAGSTPHDMSKMDMGGDSKANQGHDMNSMQEMIPETQANVEHAMFKVSGNCEMCKTTIEKAAKSLDGLNVADWNIETKQIHVSYNKDKVSLDKIHNTIAAAGYDTEKVKGDDNAYESLPECCKYSR